MEPPVTMQLETYHLIPTISPGIVAGLGTILVVPAPFLNRAAVHIASISEKLLQGLENVRHAANVDEASVGTIRPLKVSMIFRATSIVA
jgi:hypothetical protein